MKDLQKFEIQFQIHEKKKQKKNKIHLWRLGKIRHSNRLLQHHDIHQLESNRRRNMGTKEDAPHEQLLNANENNVELHRLNKTLERDFAKFFQVQHNETLIARRLNEPCLQFEV
ncbi:MAG: hypothetical protein H7835_19810 [Magnetococcus sp. XQGC-1]